MLVVNATIDFSENLFLVIILFVKIYKIIIKPPIGSVYIMHMWFFDIGLSLDPSGLVQSLDQ